jgi:hypothetical protein
LMLPCSLRWNLVYVDVYIDLLGKKNTILLAKK